ncbi:hypothetical protein SUGI_0185910 [Cryptomeria japonica]|nr:hypothetical protein SUGI_0185910 [Cryptomeria japonica]
MLLPSSSRLLLLDTPPVMVGDSVGGACVVEAMTLPFAPATNVGGVVVAEGLVGKVPSSIVVDGPSSVVGVDAKVGVASAKIPIAGNLVHPKPPPFSLGHSFSRMGRAAAHLHKSFHPLPCAKTSLVVRSGSNLNSHVFSLIGGFPPHWYCICCNAYLYSRQFSLDSRQSKDRKGHLWI